MSETTLADILFSRVNDGRVTGELTTNAGIDHAFIGHEVAGAIDVGNDQAAKVLSVDVGDVEAANVAVTLDQCLNLSKLCARSSWTRSIPLAKHMLTCCWIRSTAV